jgi:hypothetical protein
MRGLFFPGMQGLVFGNDTSHLASQVNSIRPRAARYPGSGL